MPSEEVAFLDTAPRVVYCSGCYRNLTREPNAWRCTGCGDLLCYDCMREHTCEEENHDH